MIIDSAANAGLYEGMSERIAAALRWLADNDCTALAPGEYPIDGRNVYAIVSRYETKPIEEAKWEAHRRYVDVQYVVEGTERMGCADVTTMDATADYDEAGDVVWLKGEGDFFVVRPGRFVLFTPADAHMPGLAVGTPAPVKKVVVKVLADY